MERLAHVLSEIAALNEGAMADLAAAAPPPPSAEQQMGLALRPGSPAFDLVTGQKVEVLGGTRAHYVVPTAQR